MVPHHIIPAILLGGSGRRLFQNTVMPVQHEAVSASWLLANEATLHLAEQQLSDVKSARRCRRNE